MDPGSPLFFTIYEFLKNYLKLFIFPSIVCRKTEVLIFKLLSFTHAGKFLQWRCKL